MKRIATTLLGCALAAGSLVAQNFSVDGNKVRIYAEDVKDTVRMMVIADTHLWMSDSREDPFRQYSKRMAGGYHRTRHFQTGKETNPRTAFVETLALAQKKRADGSALVGDIFSNPSEAAIEWALDTLGQVRIPFGYTCGNHDWHYEGMPGPSIDLRREWVQKRLLPMFRGENPLCYAVEIKGVRFLFVDNSTYEILPEQLDFIKREIKTRKPLVLMMHIPLYAQGRDVGFGCGHPEWGAKTDPSYKIERRPCWPEEGHSEVTMEFYDRVVNARNLLGIFCGHIHPQSLDVINGIPQLVAPGNFGGGHLDLMILPKKL